MKRRRREPQALLVTAARAAPALGLSVRQVRAGVAAGDLPGVVVRGRYYVARRLLEQLELAAAAV